MSGKVLAHVAFRGEAICGARLTGRSPQGLQQCPACVNALIDRVCENEAETSRAVALERAKIASWLESESEWYRTFDPGWHRRRSWVKPFAAAAHAVRQGAHCEATP